MLEIFIILHRLVLVAFQSVLANVQITLLSTLWNPFSIHQTTKEHPPPSLNPFALFVGRVTSRSGDPFRALTCDRMKVFV